jgi:hypothetical protein
MTTFVVKRAETRIKDLTGRPIVEYLTVMTAATVLPAYERALWSVQIEQAAELTPERATELVELFERTDSENSFVFEIEEVAPSLKAEDKVEGKLTSEEVLETLRSIAAGFRRLGFKTYQNETAVVPGVYLLVKDKAPEGPVLDSLVWLRLQVEETGEGQIAALDFKAGPQFWLRVAGLTNGSSFKEVQE